MADKPKPKRRPQGQVRAVAKDRWLCTIGLGTDPATGKRINLNHTFYGSEKEAKEWVVEKLAERNKGVPLKVAAQSVDKYLDDWLKAKRPKVRAKTLAGYEEMLQRYIRPVLGKRSLSKLTSLDIQLVYNAMAERGLSSDTLGLTHTVLRQALKKAVRLKHLTFNPTDDVELPRKQRKEMQCFNAEQARRFLAIVKVQAQWGPMFALALTAGPRPSEILGLKWSDMDFTRSTVMVQRALNYRSSTDWELAEPKTRRSRRLIKLHSDIAVLLQRHRAAQGEQQREADYWQDNDLVFCTRNGLPLEHTNVAGTFRRLISQANHAIQDERMKLPVIRLYDLRHTAASLALAAGVHPKVVSEMLGHASITLTLDTYSHVLPGMQEECVSKVEALLQNAGAEISHSISHTAPLEGIGKSKLTH